MSDVKLAVGISSEIIHLLPEKLHTNPRFNVRPFSSEITDAEDAKIEELAQAIEAVGQLDPVVITPDHTVVIGHRRRRAMLLINERRSARGESLQLLRCTVDATDGDLRQKGIISNLHRKEQSPMDMAYLCVQIRREYGWEGQGQTAKVARYLHVHPCSVTQYERFLSAEKELQNRIHNGTISAQSAIYLLKAIPTPAQRQEVLERARVLQVEDQTSKAMCNYETRRQSLRQTTEKLEGISASTNIRIERPHVLKAIREHHIVVPVKPVISKHVSLTRAELLAAIGGLDMDGVSETGRSFARYVVNVFALGRGTIDELQARFAAISLEPVDMGRSGKTAAMAS